MTYFMHSVAKCRVTMTFKRYAKLQCLVAVNMDISGARGSPKLEDSAAPPPRMGHG